MFWKHSLFCFRCPSVLLPFSFRYPRILRHFAHHIFGMVPAIRWNPETLTRPRVPRVGWVVPQIGVSEDICFRSASVLLPFISWIIFHGLEVAPSREKGFGGPSIREFLPKLITRCFRSRFPKMCVASVFLPFSFRFPSVMQVKVLATKTA